MGAFASVNKKLGKAQIKYCTPISLTEYVASYAKNNNQPVELYSKNKEAQNQLIKSLGEEITYVHSDNLVIMSSSLVASVLLQHRKGISEEEIVKKAGWVYEEIKARDGLVSLLSAPSSTSVQAALEYLKGFVDRKRNIFEPSVSAKNDYKNIVMLAYYRNNMIHLFINDAVVFCALLGLGSISDLTKGITDE